MTTVPLINPRNQFFDNNGDPLAGGKVYFYSAGTTTPKDTYTSSTGLSTNTNPVILDSAGRAAIWGTGTYKVVVKDSLDNTISTDDNYTAFFASAANQFADDVFIVTDNSNTTKKFRFEASSITAGQTRVYTMPNSNTNLIGDNTSDTLTNKTISAGTIDSCSVLLKSEATIAAAASIDGFDYDTPRVLVSGSGQSITAFDAGMTSVSADFTVRFDGANTLVHSSNLILPGSTNIFTAAGDIGYFRCEGGGQWRCVAFTRAASMATSQSTPSNPTGTTNTTGLMMGLAGSFTPGRTGKCLIIISGDLANNTASDGAKAQIRYGTGTAPANAAALTGTAVGNLVRNVGLAGSTTLVTPFSCQAIVSGLTVGTAYWIDASLAAITGGTATMADVSISVVELP